MSITSLMFFISLNELQITKLYTTQGQSSTHVTFIDFVQNMLLLVWSDADNCNLFIFWHLLAQYKTLSLHSIWFH